MQMIGAQDISNKKCLGDMNENMNVSVINDRQLTTTPKPLLLREPRIFRKL